MGLLALVLRDLVDSEITFGFGASKGYGWCTGGIARPHLPDLAAIPRSLSPGKLPAWGAGTIPNPADKEWSDVLDGWVKQIPDLRAQEVQP